jgi:Ca2+-binding RTX toxin-like protein
MPTLGSVLVGSTTTLRVSVEERPDWVANGVLNLALSPGITAVEAHGPTPCSVAASRIACPLGILAPGQVATVSAVVRGVQATGLPRFGPWNVPVARVEATVTTTGGTSRPTKTGFIRVLSTAPCANEAMTARLPDPGSFAGDRLVGTASADTFSGLGGEDCLFGKGANDTLAGGPGDDRISGDAGNDLLRGDAGGDRLVGGTGLDRFHGGPGDDRVDAVDRKRDLVRCRPGRDRARVDPADSVAGCETVKRVPAAKRR